MRNCYYQSQKTVFTTPALRRHLALREVIYKVTSEREAPTDPWEIELAHALNRPQDAEDYRFTKFWYIGHQNFSPYCSTFKLLEVSDEALLDKLDDDMGDVVQLQAFSSISWDGMQSPEGSNASGTFLIVFSSCLPYNPHWVNAWQLKKYRQLTSNSMTISRSLA